MSENRSLIKKNNLIDYLRKKFEKKNFIINGENRDKFQESKNIKEEQQNIEKSKVNSILEKKDNEKIKNLREKSEKKPKGFNNIEKEKKNKELENIVKTINVDKLRENFEKSQPKEKVKKIGNVKNESLIKKSANEKILNLGRRLSENKSLLTNDKKKNEKDKELKIIQKNINMDLLRKNFVKKEEKKTEFIDFGSVKLKFKPKIEKKINL